MKHQWAFVLVASAAFGMGLMSSRESAGEAELSGRPRSSHLSGPAITPHSEHASHPERLSCTGGPESAVRLEVVSAGSVRRAGTLQAQYELSVSGHGLGSSASIRYAVELVSEQGAEVLTPTLSDPITVVDDNPVRSLIDLPSGLPAGFYLLRVTAAAHGDSNEGSGGREVFLYSDGNGVREVSFDDWMTRSHAYEARRS